MGIEKSLKRRAALLKQLSALVREELPHAYSHGDVRFLITLTDVIEAENARMLFITNQSLAKEQGLS